jgi:hypothetical protein
MGDDGGLPPWPDDDWGRFATARGFVQRLVWVRPDHLAEVHPRIELLTPWQALHELEGWVRDERAREHLESLHARAFGPAFVHDPEERRVRIHAELRDAFASGRLVVHAELIEAGAPGHQPVQPPAKPPKSEPPPPPRPLAWIEVHLVDERGAVVPDEVALVVDPAGATHHVTTDEHGLARLGGIDPGLCDISFPRVDGREWKVRGGSFPRGSDDVAYVHRVQPRECMARIAVRYAFRSGATIWEHDCNAPLRDAGRKPDLLWPGDRVQVLARDERFEEGETNRRHHFVVKTAERWLRLTLHDVFRQPLRETPYVMALPGRPVVSGATDGTGLLEEIIPPAATEATITAGDYVWTVAIADLRPVEDVPDEGREGVLRRLRNLGCPARRDVVPRGSSEASAEEERAEPTCDADVLLHQLRVGWVASGDLDDATRDAILAEYGV